MKDWTGSQNAIFTTLGASNHSLHDRETHDYYATEPRVIDELFSVERFSEHIWEPACGEGHLSKKMEEHGKLVRSTDLIYRGYGDGNVDFLSTQAAWNGDIITNPPYKFAQEFVEHALLLQQKSELPNLKTAMFLKLTFLEGQKRQKLFKKHPPHTVYVYSSRRTCALNGDFTTVGSSASCYAWFVWEKDYLSEPIIKWL